MYIAMLHNGKASQNEMAEEIKDMLEDEGHVVDDVIGSGDELITLLTEDNEVIANFDKVPDINTLRLFVELANEEDK